MLRDVNFQMRSFTKFVQEKFGQRKLIGAEIGVQRGNNALSLIKNLQFNLLFLIDIWDAYQIATKYEEGFRDANFSVFYDEVKAQFGDLSYVRILKQDSKTAYENFAENFFDFVYIDACHSYESVKEDIEIWFPKIKVNGVFGGHDYGDRIYPGLIRAVNEFKENFKNKFYHENLDWWVVKSE